jgi:hypothetical protein
VPVLPTNTSQNYPTLDSILNLVRAIANDSFAGNTGTPGEGQVLTDLYQATTSFNAQLLYCFNSAIREMYRKLRNVKAKALIRDNYILEDLPVINGPLGPSMPDPTVQTYLTFAYYFDGTNQNTSFTLPSDLMMPLKMWERQSNTTDVLSPMIEAKNGLEASNQLDELRNWEWREGQINFRGALTQRDIRLKYLAFLPSFFPTNPVPNNYFTTTQIPVFDCEEAVAFLTLLNLSHGINPAVVPILKRRVDEAIYDLRNEEVRRMQATNYERQAWDDEQTSEEFIDTGI